MIHPRLVSMQSNRPPNPMPQKRRHLRLRSSVNCRNRSLSLNVHASIVKGDPVVVTGRLATWSWINKETGEVQDKLVLEAVSVGHDLCRGTSTFQRAERATPEPSVNDGEIFRNLENVDGDASQHSATSGQAEQAA